MIKREKSAFMDICVKGADSPTKSQVIMIEKGKWALTTPGLRLVIPWQVMRSD